MTPPFKQHARCVEIDQLKDGSFRATTWHPVVGWIFLGGPDKKELTAAAFAEHRRLDKLEVYK